MGKLIALANVFPLNSLLQKSIRKNILMQQYSINYEQAVQKVQNASKIAFFEEALGFLAHTPNKKESDDADCAFSTDRITLGATSCSTQAIANVACGASKLRLALVCSAARLAHVL